MILANDLFHYNSFIDPLFRHNPKLVKYPGTCNFNIIPGTCNFFERDNNPYCELDYHKLFSPKCAYCQGAILDVN